MFERHLEQQPDGRVTVMLSGIIDESADLDQLLGDLEGDLAIDLSGIVRINSVGIDRWVTAIAQLSSTRRITVEAVPYSIGMQANYVTNFFARAEVLSCLAPYVCPTCETSRPMLVHRDEVALRAPVRWCTGCKGELTFDEFEGYFDFLMRTRG